MDIESGTSAAREAVDHRRVASAVQGRMAPV
jgi:hypothetical protein